MKGLLRAVLVLVAAFALVVPGLAFAAPGDDADPPPPSPQPAFTGDEFLGSFALGGEYKHQVLQPAGPRYQAPELRDGWQVGLSAPRSLTVFRGSETVLSVPDITADAAMWDGEAWQIDPPGVTPAWIANRGSMIGTAMSGTIIAGHNVYGGVISPFYRLGDIRPGDMIDVTLLSGAIVRFQVLPSGVQSRPKQAWQDVSARSLYLTSCAPDGQSSVVVTAVAVSL